MIFDWKIETLTIRGQDGDRIFYEVSRDGFTLSGPQNSRIINGLKLPKNSIVFIMTPFLDKKSEVILETFCDSRPIRDQYVLLSENDLALIKLAAS